jgi:transcriptional regulator with XRE-family HTH domain
MADTPRFADYLKEARARAGLTQAGLAARCRLTGSYVSLLESGRKPSPSDPVVRRLAAALGLDEAGALQVAHLDRAPEELRRTVERLRRQARRERELRERTTEALFPFSLWSLVPPHLPGRVRTAAAGGLDAALGDALDRLASLAAASPDLAALKDASRKFLEDLPADQRRRVLAAVPDLAAGHPAAGGLLLVPAPPPGLPPRILPGDSLVVDPALAPGEGDLVLRGEGESAAVLPYEPGGPPVRGVVVEVRRRLR